MAPAEASAGGGSAAGGDLGGRGREDVEESLEGEHGGALDAEGARLDERVDERAQHVAARAGALVHREELRSAGEGREEAWEGLEDDVALLRRHLLARQ